MSLSFQLEKWAPFYAEAQPLMDLHWEEVALDQDLFKADMNSEWYEGLEKLGSLQITTARRRGRLIGYAITFLMPHSHYKSAGLVGLADMYYLLPSERIGMTGIALLLKMEQGMRDRGVVRGHMSCKVHLDLQPLLTKLGWRLTDYTFSKVLCR